MATAKRSDMMAMGEISFEDFQKVEMRIGRILEAEDFPKAKKPAYKLTIDFGEHGVKKSSAQITRKYSREELKGRLVVAVTNFPPRQVADFMSEVLVLGAETGEGVVLLGIEGPVELGSRIS